MTDSEIASLVKSIKEKKDALVDLAAKRQAEEEALVADYKVDECNSKRQDLISKYQPQVDELEKALDDLNAQLDEGLSG